MSILPQHQIDFNNKKRKGFFWIGIALGILGTLLIIFSYMEWFYDVFEISAYTLATVSIFLLTAGILLSILFYRVKCKNGKKMDEITGQCK